jgi:hypothetical protein
MSIINNTLLLADEGGGVPEGAIERSLRFRSSASAYLNRTLSSGNRKTWTWSAWVKRGIIDPTNNSYYLFSCYTNTNDNAYTTLYFFNDRLRLTGFNTLYRVTTQLFRDPSAWYHIVVVADTTQATANNRIRLYVNGVEITSFTTLNNPSQNADLGINQSAAHFIGADTYFGPTGYFDGHMTEINFVDGQALTPSSFGEFNALTGVWQPKKYAGTYGTNGFYLNFKDNASTSALGTDYSGNGNNWTTNNISLTAGATFDSMIDVPTPYDDGGNGRGNYAVLNPLDVQNPAPLSDGNLNLSGGNNIRATIAFPTSGKWYFEGTKTNATSSPNFGHFGIFSSSIAIGSALNESMLYRSDGGYYENDTLITTWASYTTNDVIGVAVNIDGNEVSFYKNNTLQGTRTIVSAISTKQAVAGARNNTVQTSVFNFGQRPFAYTPPTGFKALNTQNLPEPTIVDGGEYFNTVLYTGNGSNRSISGVGFSPDLVWIKSRNATYNNNVFDSVRGVEKYLLTDSTLAENGGSSGVGSLTAFDSDGFSLGTQAYINNNTTTFVAWNWRGSDSAAVTNTAGSITSTVSANPTAGFSIVTWTGNSTSGATIGHGLGVAPRVVIVQTRTGTNNRDKPVYHASIGNTVAMILNATSAQTTFTGFWNNTSPSSTVFTVGNDQNVNQSSSTYVAYCFAPVAGYSAFGSYTGNGSADGPFVFCGFRPRFVMIKRTNASDKWTIRDTARATTNTTKLTLNANDSQAEYTPASEDYDIVSNGFKLRTSDGAFNASGGTYIFMAFAEHPFKLSLAR